MKRIVTTLIISSFLDILSFSFILPLIPFIVRDFGGNALLTGLVVSSAAVGMFVGGVAFGKASDRFGRRNILLITTCVNILGYLFLAFSKNLTMFFLARFICGFGGGGASVTQAYLGEISTEKQRIVHMGYMGASIGLAFALGPIIGTLLYDVDIKQLGIYSALILFLSLINIYFFLPKIEKKHPQIERLHIKGAEKILLVLYSTYFVITASFAGTQAILALFLNDHFNLTSKQIGIMYGVMGIAAILYQVFCIHYLSSYLKEKWLIIFGLLLMGVGFLLVGSANGMIGLSVVLLCMVVWLSSTNSTIYSLITSHSKHDSFGANMGINTAFWSAADMVWPILTGVLYLYLPQLPFYVFWAILLVNLIILYILFHGKGLLSRISHYPNHVN